MYSDNRCMQLLQYNSQLTLILIPYCTCRHALSLLILIVHGVVHGHACTLHYACISVPITAAVLYIIQTTLKECNHHIINNYVS